MSRRSSRHPTDLELEILRVLWKDQPVTVTHVHEQLSKKRDVAYSTVATVLAIMVRKGYIARTGGKRSSEYRTRISQGSTARKMLRDLAQRILGLSLGGLVLKVLEEEQIDEEELKQIKALSQGKVKPKRNEPRS